MGPAWTWLVALLALIVVISAGGFLMRAVESRRPKPRDEETDR